MSCSLTSPADRQQRFVASSQTIPASDVDVAKSVLLKDIRFLQIEKHFVDPPQYNQKIALVSFIPSKTAKPDKDGFYGFMKVRGVYGTEEEANERAEYLISNVDSYHEINHVHVGRPFPVTVAEGYAAEVKKVDVKKKATQVISEDILEKKRQEKQEIEEMKRREKALIEEGNKAQRDEPVVDDFDQYITEQVKRAQLIWTYVETKKKLQQMKESIHKVSEVIQEYDTTHPDFFGNYREKYYNARKEAGLPAESEGDENSFLKFLGLDLSDALNEDDEKTVVKTNIDE